MSQDRWRGWLLGCGCALGLLVSCAGGGTPLGDHKEPRTPSVSENHLEVAGCPETFDPTLDYFSNRSEPAFARGFTVSYHRNFKVVTLENSRRDERDHRYLLVQCGAPVPEGYDDATVIQVPVRRVITTSTTELPAFVMLDETDHLIGHASFDYVYAPEVRERIGAGLMVEVGASGSLDVERIIAAAPDLLLADTLGNPEFDPTGMLGVLQTAGVPVVIVPSFLESTPLGRAEWLKYVALFFNREAEANVLFEEIVTRYLSLAAQGRSAPDRPTVITGGPAGDTWHVPGGQSFAARLLADAGFDYVFAEDETTGSRVLAFEAVFAEALDANWWIRPRGWASRKEILAGDSRLGALAAFRAGQVVTIDARMNESGGNDFWESGTARPDWLLEDLVSLAQPHLVPGHRLRFYRVLGQDEP